METLEKNFYADRINEICKARKCNCKELAAECGIPYSTFQRYASGHSEPRAEAFAAFHQFGINLDWFVTGEGQMYRANREEAVVEKAVSSVWTGYVPRHSDVAQSQIQSQSGGMVRERTNDTGGRSNRLCQFARYWMETKPADDQAWLEKQIERAVPEYAEWKRADGR